MRLPLVCLPLRAFAPWVHTDGCLRCKHAAAPRPQAAEPQGAIVPGLSECKRRPVRGVRHSGKHLLAAYSGESLGDDLPHRLQGHLASVCAAGLRTIRTRPRCVCWWARGRVHAITNLEHVRTLRASAHTHVHLHTCKDARTMIVQVLAIALGGGKHGAKTLALAAIDHSIRVVAADSGLHPPPPLLPTNLFLELHP